MKALSFWGITLIIVIIACWALSIACEVSFYHIIGCTAFVMAFISIAVIYDANKVK